LEQRRSPYRRAFSHRAQGTLTSMPMSGRLPSWGKLAHRIVATTGDRFAKPGPVRLPLSIDRCWRSRMSSSNVRVMRFTLICIIRDAFRIKTHHECWRRIGHPLPAHRRRSAVERSENGICDSATCGAWHRVRPWPSRRRPHGARRPLDR
jgi:hypothetical protein